MKKIFCLSLSLVSLVTAVSAVTACGDEKDSHLMEGQCGMSGMKVECIKHSDCLREGTDSNYCMTTGNCTHDMPGAFTCFSTGTPCLYNDKVCGTNSLCTYPCETHADCPDTDYCDCSNDGSYCAWSRCYEGNCVAGTHPDQGSLLCIPNKLEGECYGPNNTCPDGYIKIADGVGPGLVNGACVADN